MSYSTSTWMFSEGQVDVMMTTLNTSESNGGRSILKSGTVSTNCSGIISSTTNIINQEINIYPNPNKGKLIISTSDKITSISITNIIGKEVFSQIKFNDNSIDLNSFKNGVYFVSINTNKGAVTKKIILTK